MKQSPMDRLEAERKVRGASKRQFALFLGVSAQTYNHWAKRGVPNDLDEQIAGKLRWTLDYLRRGKRDAGSGDQEERSERTRPLDEIAARLTDAALRDLLTFAKYLEWRDAPTKQKRREHAVAVQEKARETERA